MHWHADIYIGQHGDVADIFANKAQATFLFCMKCSETQVATCLWFNKTRSSYLLPWSYLFSCNDSSFLSSFSNDTKSQ